MEKKTFIYIGEKFYSKSDTLMSFIYEITDEKPIRSDFGTISKLLREGHEIVIQQANERQLEWAEEFLNLLLKLQEDNGNGEQFPKDYGKSP